jgi:hypothetical protein
LTIQIVTGGGFLQKSKAQSQSETQAVIFLGLGDLVITVYNAYQSSEGS